MLNDNLTNNSCNNQSQLEDKVDRLEKVIEGYDQRFNTQDLHTQKLTANTANIANVEAAGIKSDNVDAGALTADSAVVTGSIKAKSFKVEDPVIVNGVTTPTANVGTLDATDINAVNGKITNLTVDNLMTGPDSSLEYKNLSVTNQATINKLNLVDPHVAEVIADNAKVVDFETQNIKMLSDGKITRLDNNANVVSYVDGATILGDLNNDVNIAGKSRPKWNDASLATLADIQQGAVKPVYRGTVVNYNELPPSGNAKGDLYIVKELAIADKVGIGHAQWNGESWDPSLIYELELFETKEAAEAAVKALEKKISDILDGTTPVKKALLADNIDWIKSLSNESLNNVVTPGKYIIRYNNVSTITGGPEWLTNSGNIYATLFVLNWAGSDKQQILIGGGHDCNISLRYNSSGGNPNSWQKWINFATLDGNSNRVKTAWWLTTSDDTQDQPTKPSEYDHRLSYHLKKEEAMGLPKTSTGRYTVMGMKAWSDNSGDYGTEIAFSNNEAGYPNKMYIRTGNLNDDTWQEWQELAVTDRTVERKPATSYKDLGFDQSKKSTIKELVSALYDKVGKVDDSEVVVPVLFSSSDSGDVETETGKTFHLQGGAFHIYRLYPLTGAYSYNILEYTNRYTTVKIYYTITPGEESETVRFAAQQEETINLADCKLLPKGSNLNDVRTPGTYYIYNDAPINQPITPTGEFHYSRLIVSKFNHTSSDRYQYFIPFDSGKEGIYERFFNSGNWTEWKAYPTEEDIWSRKRVYGKVRRNFEFSEKEWGELGTYNKEVYWGITNVDEISVGDILVIEDLISRDDQDAATAFSKKAVYYGEVFKKDADGVSVHSRRVDIKPSTALFATELYPKQLKPGADLNNIITPGRYYVFYTDMGNISNVPSNWSGASYATIMVISWAGSDKQQIFIGSGGQMASRVNTGGGRPENWSSWRIMFQ